MMPMTTRTILEKGKRKGRFPPVGVLLVLTANFASDLRSVDAWAPQSTTVTAQGRSACAFQYCRLEPLHGKRKEKGGGQKQEADDKADTDETESPTPSPRELEAKRKVDEKPIQDLLTENYSFDSYDPSNVDMDQLPVPFLRRRSSRALAWCFGDTSSTLPLWGYHRRRGQR